MRTKLLIGVIALTLIAPSVSHGFGILRYAFDAVANQLGLDRGPIPKVIPKVPPPYVGHRVDPSGKQRYQRGPYMQAEGF